MNFGDKVVITERNVTTNVKNDTPRFFQVSDLRETGAGWKLNVSLGAFTPIDSTSTATPIDGATITFKNGEADTSNQSNENAVKVHDISLTAGKEDDVQTLMSVDSGTGSGAWIARFTAETGATENEKIVFNSPTNKISTDTSYQATLTWQLVDGVK